MNKRGQELSLNTLIVIILLVIVLIVVAVFFLGGTSSLSKSIRSIFYGTTAGTDLNLAIETCRQRCEQAKSFPSVTISASAYCSQPFNMDTKNAGKVDMTDESTTGKPVNYYCWQNPINVRCPDIEDKCNRQVT